MKKRYIIAVLTLIIVLASMLALVGCNKQLGEADAWAEFNDAMTASKNHLQDGKDYFVKYRYKEGEVTVTQKLNVSFNNSYIKDWDGFVVADRSVERASKIKTDYANTYFGYSLKSGVKAKKATKEDYKLGYITGKVFVEGMTADEFFALKAGDTVNGKVLTADEEVYKYTLENALSTLEGLNADSAKILSAVKNGSVTTLKIAVENSELYYGKYNSESNCLIIQMTVGRITKISSADVNEPVFYINYAGPKLTLQNYDKEGMTLAQA